MKEAIKIESEVYAFIEEWTRYSNITPQTLIDRDLGLYGTDCVEFLLAFSEKFKVNFDDFDYEAHFDITYIFALIKLVKDIWHKKKISFFDSVDVSVEDLIVSANKGYWSPAKSYYLRVKPTNYEE